MELELGLKITQSKDDLTSTTDVRIAKDPSGPVFISRETDSKFILTAHLKGFVREQIGININEDGTEIAINGERPVQEMVMSGWMVHKKEVELKGFIKVFRIPHGVILDRIKAKFNEQESVLTILMPKSTKGIRGVGIEEVKEEEEVVDRGRPEITPSSTTKEVYSPSVGNVEETDRADDMAQEKDEHVVGDSAKEKIKEPKIKRRQETGQVSGDEAEKQGIRSTKEKVDEPKIEKKEKSDGVGEEKVEEEKLERAQVVSDKISKREEKDEKARIQEPDIKTSEEIEQHKEKNTTHKSETPAVKETSQQAKEVKPDLVRPQMTKQAPSEDGERKKIQEEGIPEENNVIESKSSKSLEPVHSQPSIPENQGEALEQDHLKDEEARDREEKSNEKGNEVQGETTKEEEKQTEDKEASRVPEPPKMEEKKESIGERTEEKTMPTEEGEKQTEHKDISGVTESANNKVEEKKERIEEGIQEKTKAATKGDKQTEDKEANSLHESPKLEEKKESTGEGREENTKAVASSRKIKLCTPCVIAGSSIIVSLVVFAIHWIRSKKREVH